MLGKKPAERPFGDPRLPLCTARPWVARWLPSGRMASNATDASASSFSGRVDAAISASPRGAAVGTTAGLEPIAKKDISDSSSSSSLSARDVIGAKQSIGSTSLESQPVLAVQPLHEEMPRYIGKSLFLFEPDHPVRAVCIKVISNRIFKWFILLTIVVNSIFLAIQDPTKSDRSGFNRVIHIADYFFLAIFASEAALKIIAMGFILHQKSYLRGACMLDIGFFSSGQEF